MNSGRLAVEESDEEKCQDELTRIGNNSHTQCERRSSSPSGDGDTSQVKNPPAKLSETQKSEALDENLVDDGNEEQEFQIVELDTINATSNQLSNTSNNVHSGSTVLSRKSPSKRVRGKVDPAIKSNRRSRLLNIKFKLPKSTSTDKQLTKSVSNEELTEEQHLSNTASDTDGSLILGPDPVIISSNRNIAIRAKQRTWYSIFYPNYKDRSKEFKRLFKDLPKEERLIVDYSCSLYKDILLQGRLYASQNYICFHSSILRWETYLSLKWKDVTAIKRQCTALVIPNAISICVGKEENFFAWFTTRDSAFLVLSRLWQNTLQEKPVQLKDLWQDIHKYYGDELGLTSDDERDYVDPRLLSPVINNATKTTKSVSIKAENQSSVADNCLNSSSDNGENSSIAILPRDNRRIQLVSSVYNKRIFRNPTTVCLSSSESCADNQKHITPKVEFRVCKIMSSSSSIGQETANLSSESAKPKQSASAKTNKSKQREDTNLEVIPTDMSDSSDSDTNVPRFVATVDCNSPHEGRQMVHTILPINIETLFNLLFSKSKFLLDFHKMRNSTELKFGEWGKDEKGRTVRKVNVTVQLSASVGPKTSKVTEHQVMRDCSKEGELYSIDIESTNAGIPYAESFMVTMHYCLVKTVDDHTMLSVHAQIKYKKSIWGVVKGFIEKNTWAGLEDFYNALLYALQSETCIPPAKGKGRRPRRGLMGQQRTTDEQYIPQQKGDSPNHGPKMVNSKHLKTTSATVETDEKAVDPYKYRTVSLCVLFILCFLFIVNSFLLFKLWRLENQLKEANNSPFRADTKFAMNAFEENWREVLQQQNLVHEGELQKWNTILQAAVKMLKKTENILAELLSK